MLDTLYYMKIVFSENIRPGATIPFLRTSGSAYPAEVETPVIVGPPIPMRMSSTDDDVENEDVDDDDQVSEEEISTTDENSCNKIAITTEENSGVPGLFSPAILAGNTLYISGQLGFEPDTVRLGRDIRTQVRMALEAIQSLLTASAASVDDLVKVTVLLADINDYSAMNEVYQEFFEGSTAPARAAYQVGALPFAALVEIEAVAQLTPAQTRAVQRTGQCANK